MYNDFVLMGPPDDPARVKGAPNIQEAMRRIATSTSTFLSRGDQSGTHEREQQLWTLAATRPADDRLVVAGAGMGTTLRVASQTGAYTLTDRATFAQHADTVRLAVVFEGGPHLLNTYAVVVDTNGPHSADALAFAHWLSDGNGRGVIAEYRVAGKVPAFQVWPAGRARQAPGDLPQ